MTTGYEDILATVPLASKAEQQPTPPAPPSDFGAAAQPLGAPAPAAAPAPAPAAPGPYDDILATVPTVAAVKESQRRDEERRAQYLQYSMASDKREPGQVAEVLRLATALEWTPEQVEKDLPAARAQADAKKLDAQAVLDAHPALAEFIGDPKTSALARGDTETLTGLAYLIGEWGLSEPVLSKDGTEVEREAMFEPKTPGVIGLWLRQRELARENHDLLSELAGEGGYEAARASGTSVAQPGLRMDIALPARPQKTPEQIEGVKRTIRKNEEELAKLRLYGDGVEGLGGVKKVLAKTVRLLVDMGPEMLKGSLATMVPVPGSGSAYWAQEMYPSVYWTLSELKHPDTGKPLLTDAEAREGAGFASGALGPVMAGSLGSMGLAGRQALMRSPAVQQILAKALPATAQKVLARQTVPMALARATMEYGQHAVTGGLMMAAQSGIEAATVEAAKASHGVEARPEVIAEAAAEGFTTGIADFVLISAWSPARRFFHERGVIKSSIDSARALKDVAEGTKNSKLAKTDPEAFGKLLSKFGPDKVVYLERRAIDELAQEEKVDARALAAELVGDGGAAYDKAAASNGDVVVPVAKWAEKVVLSGRADKLAEDARVSLDEMTPRRMVEAAKARQKELEQRLEGRRDAFEQEVRDLNAKLERAARKGGYGRDQAQSWAKTLTSYVSTMALNLDAPVRDTMVRVGLPLLHLEGKNVVTGEARAEFQGPAEGPKRKQAKVKPEAVAPVEAALSEAAPAKLVAPELEAPEPRRAPKLEVARELGDLDPGIQARVLESLRTELELTPAEEKAAGLNPRAQVELERRFKDFALEAEYGLDGAASIRAGAPVDGEVVRLADFEPNPDLWADFIAHIRDTDPDLLTDYWGSTANPRGIAGYFFSGSNQTGEIRGLAAKGQHIGVAVQELSRKGVEVLKALRGRDVKVFLDSGAFSEVEFGPGGPRVVAPITPAEWARRLAVFKELAGALGDQLYVVAPDMVGHQTETLARLKTYRAEVRDLVKAGANVIIALQGGAIPKAEFWKQAQAVLGVEGLIAGIPSAKAAATVEDISSFVREAKPERVHLLGIGPRARGGRFNLIIDAIADANPDTKVFADSAFMVSLKVSGRAFTERRREVAAKAPEATAPELAEVATGTTVADLQARGGLEVGGVAPAKPAEQAAGTRQLIADLDLEQAGLGGEGYVRAEDLRQAIRSDITPEEAIARDMTDATVRLAPGAERGFLSDGTFDVEAAAAGILESPDSELNQGIMEAHDGKWLRGSELPPEEQRADAVLVRHLQAKLGGEGKHVTVLDHEGKEVVYSGDAQWSSLEEAAAWARNAKFLEPLVNTEDKQTLRWSRQEQDASGVVRLTLGGKPVKLAGNDKMQFPNDAYPFGRNTWDDFGCGRRPWAVLNKLSEIISCYGGKCYADALAKGKGGQATDVMTGQRMVGLHSKDARRVHGDAAFVEAARAEFAKAHPDVDLARFEEMRTFYRVNGKTALFENEKFFEKMPDPVKAGDPRPAAEKKAVKELRKKLTKEREDFFANFEKQLEVYGKAGEAAVKAKYPELEVSEVSAQNVKMKSRERAGNPEWTPPNVSLGVLNSPQASATVYTKLQAAKGQDIRLGVDTDGGAWLSSPEVMDAILAAEPRILSIYSSAYHTPPPRHALAGRTIINVTVSGWHPIGETLSRLRWAEEARANGWNVILREVVADPEVFGPEKASVYNRIHEGLLKTGFFIMQQPLHEGDAHGKEMWGLPGCCKGSKKNAHKCDQCEVTEGLGDRFQAYWGIAEEPGKATEQLLPDVPDYRGRQLGRAVGAGTVQLGRGKDRLTAPIAQVGPTPEPTEVVRGEAPAAITAEGAHITVPDVDTRVRFDAPEGELGQEARVSAEDAKVQMATSRPWPETAVSKHLEELLPPSKAGRVLDFGAGKDAAVTQTLRGRGYKVDAHDLWAMRDPEVAARGLHLTRPMFEERAGSYDTVLLSNVLNVQNSPAAMDALIAEVKQAMKPGGRVIANLPSTPRKGWYGEQTQGKGGNLPGATRRAQADKLEAYLKQHFGVVERKGGADPMFVLRKPIAKAANLSPEPARAASFQSAAFDAVRAVLTPELLAPDRRDAYASRGLTMAEKVAGHCAGATDALQHLLGGPDGPWVHMVIKREHLGGPDADTHHFLKHRETGEILDPTWEQFGKKEDIPYGKATRYAAPRSSKYAGQPTATGRGILERARAQLAESGALADEDALNQEAFHGTGVRGIKEMSTKHVGSGQGAAAFGWGIYSSESRAVAEAYRAELAAPGEKGQTYRLRVPEKDQLFDWDRPLAEQPPVVREKLVAAMRQFGGFMPGDTEMDGGAFYQRLAEHLFRQEYGGESLPRGEEGRNARHEAYRLASMWLKDAGIEGLKYFDGDSRSLPTAVEVRRSDRTSYWSVDGTNEQFTSRQAANDYIAQGRTHNFVVWNDEAMAVTGELFQRRRGTIRFRLADTGAPVDFDIRALAGDASTLAHETGHWLSWSLHSVATGDGAPEKVRADYAALLKFAGWESAEQRLAENRERSALSKLKVRTEEQEARRRELEGKEEKLSHAWEQYLAEGKAPSGELAGTFHRFKRWMTEVYKNLDGIKNQYRKLYGKDIELSDEVRGVFDRLLATESEVDRMKAEDAKQDVASVLRLTPQEQDELRRLREVKYAEASTRLYAGLTDAQSKNGELLNAERERIRAEVHEEVSARREHVARDFLQTGELLDPESGKVFAPSQLPEALKDEAGRPLRLSEASALELAGKEGAGVLRVQGVTAKEGVSADELAPFLGFDSGKALVDALVKTPEKDKVVEQETAGRFEETFGPELHKQGEVLRAIGADAARGPGDLREALFLRQALARELGRKGDTGLDEATLRRTADRINRDQPVGSLSPKHYLDAERASSRRAYEFATQAARARDVGKQEEADTFYRQALHEWDAALLNRMLWRDAAAKATKLDAARAKLDRATKTPWFQKLGKADIVYADAHEGILRAIGVIEQPMNAADRGLAITNIERTLAAMERDGGEVVRDEDGNLHSALWDSELVRRVVADSVPWERLTFAEAMDVVDAVDNIRATAARKNKVTIAERKMEKKELLDKVEASARRLAPTPEQHGKSFFGSVWRRIVGVGRSLDANMTEVEALVERLVGNDRSNPLWELLVAERLRARDRELALTQEYGTKLKALWDNLPAEMRANRDEVVEGARAELPLPDTQGVIDPKSPVRRYQLWMMALNMGNAGNLQRLLDGYGWTEKQVRHVLYSHMTEAEWRWVQGVWTTLKGLYPLIVDVHVKDQGLRPAEVEATPFWVMTSDGVPLHLEGGYFPARYDPRVPTQGGAGEKQVADSTAALLTPSYRKPKTVTSHAKARAKKVEDLLNLELDVVPAHVAQVIHDVTHRLYIKEAASVILDPRFKAIVKSRLGQEYEPQFPAWLRSVAAQYATAGDPMGTVDSILSFTKSRATLASVGFNVGVPLADLTNPLLPVMAGELSPASLARVTTRLATDWKEMRAFALEHSQELRHRAEHGNGLGINMANVVRNRGYLGEVEHAAYWMMEQSDRMTSTPIWLAKFHELRDAGSTHYEAVRDADALVRKYFPSQTPDQKANWLRDKGLMGSLTFLYGFGSKVYNMNRRTIVGAYDKWRDPASSPADKARAVGAAMAVLALQAAVTGSAGEFMAGRGPKKDDDAKERLKWTLESMAASGAQSVPVVQLATGGGGRGTLPAKKLVEKLGREAKRIATGEAGVAEAVGALGALAAGGAGLNQATKTGQYVDQKLREDLRRGRYRRALSGALLGERDNVTPLNVGAK